MPAAAARPQMRVLVAETAYGRPGSHAATGSGLPGGAPHSSGLHSGVASQLRRLHAEVAQGGLSPLASGSRHFGSSGGLSPAEMLRLGAGAEPAAAGRRLLQAGGPAVGGFQAAKYFTYVFMALAIAVVGMMCGMCGLHCVRRMRMQQMEADDARPRTGARPILTAAALMPMVRAAAPPASAFPLVASCVPSLLLSVHLRSRHCRCWRAKSKPVPSLHARMHAWTFLMELDTRC